MTYQEIIKRNFSFSKYKCIAVTKSGVVLPSNLSGMMWERWLAIPEHRAILMAVKNYVENSEKSDFKINLHKPFDALQELYDRQGKETNIVFETKLMFYGLPKIFALSDVKSVILEFKKVAKYFSDGEVRSILQECEVPEKCIDKFLISRTGERADKYVCDHNGLNKEAFCDTVKGFCPNCEWWVAKKLKV